MTSGHFHLITGASGAGKSTMLQALREQGFPVMPEAALAIVQEQVGRDGTGLPDTGLQAFMNQVVDRNIRAYDAALSLPPPVFFDRGIPECLAHMRRQATRHAYCPKCRWPSGWRRRRSPDRAWLLERRGAASAALSPVRGWILAEAEAMQASIG